MNQVIITELNKILPVVERIHGDSHPELHEVAKLYTELKENPSNEVFEQLRQVTSNYTIPEDACPTFEKVYKDLSILDQEL